MCIHLLLGMCLSTEKMFLQRNMLKAFGPTNAGDQRVGGAGFDAGWASLVRSRPLLEPNVAVLGLRLSLGLGMAGEVCSVWERGSLDCSSVDVAPEPWLPEMPALRNPDYWYCIWCPLAHVKSTNPHFITPKIVGVDWM